MRTELLAGRRIDYDGSQLRPGFVAEVSGIEPDAVLAFRGACDVSPEHMVDLDDLAAGAEIRSEDMLHFIAEFSERDMTLSVAMELLFATGAMEELTCRELPAKPLRRGDDIYIAGRKLSIGIATISPVSSLFHFAVNVTAETAPVPAIGLAELGIEPEEFALALLKRFQTEQEAFLRARVKVRHVG